MKRILSTAFIIALSFGAAQAQTTEGSTKKEQGLHRKGDRQGMGMSKLNLTADQQARIKTINENYHKQVTALKGQTNITVADAKSRREALQKQHRADIQAVLTAEQKAQMETAKKEWKAKGQRGDFRKGDGARKDTTGFGKRGDRKEFKGKREGMAKMQQELNLSADQQAKMAKLREEFKTKSEGIRSNTALSQEQKKEQFKAAAQQHRDQVKTILTKEQVEKIEAARVKRSAKNTK
jgi:Spy/CpxP family protein refolding chaperone